MIDVAQKEDGDISLETGDFMYTESTGQHQRDILLANKGHYKGSPVTGVGVVDYLHDAEPENLLRAVRKEFARDGMKVNDIKMINGQLEVDAEYADNNS